jgi:hypothetical protein
MNTHLRKKPQSLWETRLCATGPFNRPTTAAQSAIGNENLAQSLALQRLYPLLSSASVLAPSPTGAREIMIATMGFMIVCEA